MAKTSRKPIGLAIIGTGGMAHAHADSFAKIPGCRLLAACDIDGERAAAFARKFDIPHAFSDLREVLARPDISAVSIVTPDAFHTPLSLACLRAGRHVLCEKPLALNYPDARKMARAAARAGVVNLVNFTYRNWPALEGVAAAIRAGTLGELRHVEANYLQSWLSSKVWGDWRTSPQWLWRLSSAHGSKGVLGDIGVHILDFATYPAGPLRELTCRLKTFPKAPGDRVGDYVLDANDSAVIMAEFANGALGVIHTTRWSGGHVNRLFLKISGTLGAVEIDSDRSTTSYRLSAGKNLDAGKWEEVACPPVPSIYQRFIQSIRQSPAQGQKTPASASVPDFARGAEIQRLLDACFTSESEKRSLSFIKRG